MSDSHVTLTHHTLHDKLLAHRQGDAHGTPDSLCQALAVLSALAVFAHYYAYFTGTWQRRVRAARPSSAWPPALMKSRFLVRRSGRSDLMKPPHGRVSPAALGAKFALLLSAVVVRLSTARCNCSRRPGPRSDLVLSPSFRAGSFPQACHVLRLFLWLPLFHRLREAAVCSVVPRVVQLTAALLIVLIGPSRCHDAPLAATRSGRILPAVCGSRLLIFYRCVRLKRMRRPSRCAFTASCCSDGPGPVSPGPHFDL